MRVNNYIRSTWARVIGKDGENLGIIETRKAIALAEESGMDLVQVSVKADEDTPVCRIMDYGKYKYDLQKKARAAKKKQSVVELKEIQVRPKTEEHDLAHKAKKSLGFIADGNKVKVIVFFRGFELSRIETGYDTLIEFIKKIDDKAVIETPPKMEGRRISLILSPITPGKKLPAGHLLASLPTYANARIKAPPPPQPRRRR